MSIRTARRTESSSASRLNINCIFARRAFEESETISSLCACRVFAASELGESRVEYFHFIVQLSLINKNEGSDNSTTQQAEQTIK